MPLMARWIVALGRFNAARTSRRTDRVVYAASRRILYGPESGGQVGLALLGQYQSHPAIAFCECSNLCEPRFARQLTHRFRLEIRLVCGGMVIFRAAGKIKKIHEHEPALDQYGEGALEKRQGMSLPVMREQDSTGEHRAGFRAERGKLETVSNDEFCRWDAFSLGNLNHPRTDIQACAPRK